MKNLLLLAISLPLLLGGCGEKGKVKPEEPVAEVKSVEEVPLNPSLKYEIKDGAVTITDCDEGASGKLVIPATIEGKTVTSIWIGAFGKCTGLTSITIPDGVTSIGNNAFWRCTSLKSVTFLGDAPKWSAGVFYKATPTIYRKSDAKGWGDTFGGRPVKLISEKPVGKVPPVEEKVLEVKEEVKPEDSVAETKPELNGVHFDMTELREGRRYLKSSDLPYTGKAFMFYKSGKKRTEGNWKDGKKEGLVTSWKENGEKETESNYKNGKLDGLMIWWHSNVQKMTQQQYEDGKLISRKYWNRKGEPVDSFDEAVAK